MKGIVDAVYEENLPKAFRRKWFTVYGVETNHWWTDDGGYGGHENSKPKELRAQKASHLRNAARLEATARAIEAENTETLIEQKAPECYGSGMYNEALELSKDLSEENAQLRADAIKDLKTSREWARKELGL